jgi:predicted CXXCH cytochrome family protein
MILRRRNVGDVFILIGFIIMILAIFSVHNQAQASPNLWQTQPVSDETCLACHTDPGQTFELPSGELLYFSVDPQVHVNSIHGQSSVACVQCHTDISAYPHPPIQANTLREYALEQYRLCQDCHTQPYAETTNDAHQLAIEQGMLEAAVCADCHGAHDITSLSHPRSRIPQTCERCHSLIFQEYRESVHGAALLGAGNPDVPDCVDCHNHHNVQGPSNTQFALFSPELCARCHADRELAERYGMNPYVYDTYVADFHGTTITIFQNVAPGQRPNQAVCIDCHGAHAIIQVDDPESVRENILPTCQRCHPQATINFPASWLSHYPPSPRHAPLVFYARMFYVILIPALIGGMVIFVIGDIGRRLTSRKEEEHNE